VIKIERFLKISIVLISMNDRELGNYVADYVLGAIDNDRYNTGPLSRKLHKEWGFRTEEAAKVYLDCIADGIDWYRPNPESEGGLKSARRISILLTELETPEDHEIIQTLREYYGIGFEYPPERGAEVTNRENNIRALNTAYGRLTAPFKRYSKLLSEEQRRQLAHIIGRLDHTHQSALKSLESAVNDEE
jgi:hypothetical protein